MSTENEISAEKEITADDRREVDFPALVEAITYQVLKNVALAIISEGAMQAREPASAAERTDAPVQMDFYDEVRRFEIRLIRQALRQAHGKQNAAAQLLGLKATTLNAKMKQYQMRENGRTPGSPQPPSGGGGSRSASA